MTQNQLEQYLRDMDKAQLLGLLYNGWRLTSDLPEVENVTLELAINDEAFCKFTKENLEDEYNKGI